MAKTKTSYVSWRQAPIRRTYQVASSRFVLAPLIIISLILIGVLFYYYNRYTQIIEAGLRGDIFVRSSGIYAGPLNLKDGMPARLSNLLSHLHNVGYQERGTTQNEKRGQFIVRANAIEIYPGSDTLIDGVRIFPNIRVVFGRDGNGIQSITNLDSRQQIQEAQVEPELISSIINQEREKRKIIEYKDLPQNLVDAIVTVEDQQFFEHSGINWRGILRALIRDYQAGEIREGGSSITQQLVKNFFLKPDRTFKRKLAEAYMSIILEQRLSKEEIMAMYCNQIYLGQRGGFSINGFGQAARAYFGKDISSLSLSESAFLGGIIRSPNYYSPYANEERSRERRNLVLEMMVDVGKVNRTESDAAKRQPLGITGKAGGVDASDAPYFVDFLMRQLEAQYAYAGQSLRSMRIYSTIDLDLQRVAYQAVTKNMVDVERMLAKRRGGTVGLQAALVAMNAKTGEILAMVGGRDYATSQLNRATDAKRQPGSVFKPFVYATALEQGNEGLGTAITPATMFVDEPKTFEFEGRSYDPGNFGDKYEMRPMTVRDALVNSKNVITVEIAQRVGFIEIQHLAERAGLTKIPPYPSMALGVGEATPLQMTSAYTIFANQGKRAAPVAIKRITTKDGSTIFESKTESREVITPQVAYIMTSIMQDVLDRGTGTRVRQMGFKGTAAGKTGSSRDAWFAGYTPNIVCLVWIGFDDNSDIGLTGGATAAPIWADFMIRALQIRPELGGNFNPPEEGIVTYDIDPTTGAIAHDGANVRQELFLRGTEPGGQALPDSSIPEAEPPATRIDIESPRPTPTPRPIGDDRSLTTSIDDSSIPLPPEARRTRTRQEPYPSSESTRESPRGAITKPPPPQTSFFSKLAAAFGFGSPSPPKPTPTPWASGGLKPASQLNLEEDESLPITPEARRKLAGDTFRETTDFSAPRPTPQISARKSGTQAPKPMEFRQPATRPRIVNLPKPKPTPTPRPIVTKRSTKPVKPKPAPTVIAKSTREREKPSPTPTPKIVAAAKPTPTPTPPPVVVPTPTPAPVSPPQAGTFVLEVCSVSGLLPVSGVCTSTVRRRFKLGQEPTTFCSASRHQ